MASVAVFLSQDRPNDNESVTEKQSTASPASESSRVLAAVGTVIHNIPVLLGDGHSKSLMYDKTSNEISSSQEDLINSSIFQLFGGSEFVEGTGQYILPDNLVLDTFISSEFTSNDELILCRDFPSISGS
eukprot:GHVH01014607.1.p1 GENE.GHVH01014607.1~~GHVH01014607.1.p1  ORF type:complete len:130 (+),score=19.40 GHVH01014607.1:35-424(+)